MCPANQTPRRAGQLISGPCVGGGPMRRAATPSLRMAGSLAIPRLSVNFKVRFSCQQAAFFAVYEANGCNMTFMR